ncbi:MAG: endonuclease/exonuclease/phosphatase family protein [Gemmatimonadota bacterium]
MRILTYNFLSGGSNTRNAHWSRVLRRARQPAIILTQEAKPPARVRGGDTHYWRAVPGYRWGSGILVRGLPSAEIMVLGFEGWVIGAEIPLAHKLRVFSIHCPAGAHGYVRTLHELLDAITPAAAGADVILGGDFNVAAGFRGAHEPVRMSRAERVVLERITEELDLVPCWQAMHLGRPLAQTLRWTANRAAPYHCDGIFIPRAWLPRLTRCEILSDADWDRLSDHNPVVATLTGLLPHAIES